MKKALLFFIKPVLQSHWTIDFLFFIPRFVCGLLLSIDFGSSKFGMPWTSPDHNLALFQVAEWFPKDVAEYGGLFALSPVFFAWMGAASEAIGGLFLAFGFKTRLASFFILCTMLVAIFFQKWGNGAWSLLPAMGFLWVALYHLFLGSGRFGVDYLITKFSTPSKIETPISELV